MKWPERILLALGLAVVVAQVIELIGWVRSW